MLLTIFKYIDPATILREAGTTRFLTLAGQFPTIGADDSSVKDVLNRSGIVEQSSNLPRVFIERFVKKKSSKIKLDAENNADLKIPEMTNLVLFRTMPIGQFMEKVFRTIITDQKLDEFIKSMPLVERRIFLQEFFANPNALKILQTKFDKDYPWQLEILKLAEKMIPDDPNYKKISEKNLTYTEQQKGSTDLVKEYRKRSDGLWEFYQENPQTRMMEKYVDYKEFEQIREAQINDDLTASVINETSDYYGTFTLVTSQDKHIKVGFSNTIRGYQGDDTVYRTINIFFLPNPNTEVDTMSPQTCIYDVKDGEEISKVVETKDHNIAIIMANGTVHTIGVPKIGQPVFTRNALIYQK